MYSITIKPCRRGGRTYTITRDRDGAQVPMKTFCETVGLSADFVRLRRLVNSRLGFGTGSMEFRSLVWFFLDKRAKRLGYDDDRPEEVVFNEAMI